MSSNPHQNEKPDQDESVITPADIRNKYKDDDEKQSEPNKMKDPDMMNYHMEKGNDEMFKDNLSEAVKEYLLYLEEDKEIGKYELNYGFLEGLCLDNSSLSQSIVTQYKSFIKGYGSQQKQKPIISYSVANSLAACILSIPQISSQIFVKQLAQINEKFKRWEIYDILGNMYLKRINYEQASINFNRALQINPTQAYSSVLGLIHIEYLKKQQPIQQQKLKLYNQAIDKHQSQSSFIIAKTKIQLKQIYLKMIAQTNQTQIKISKQMEEQLVGIRQQLMGILENKKNLVIGKILYFETYDYDLEELGNLDQVTKIDHIKKIVREKKQQQKRLEENRESKEVFQEKYELLYMEQQNSIANFKIILKEKNNQIQSLQDKISNLKRENERFLSILSQQAKKNFKKGNDSVQFIDKIGHEQDESSKLLNQTNKLKQRTNQIRSFIESNPINAQYAKNPKKSRKIDIKEQNEKIDKLQNEFLKKQKEANRYMNIWTSNLVINKFQNIVKQFKDNKVGLKSQKIRVFQNQQHFNKSEAGQSIVQIDEEVDYLSVGRKSQMTEKNIQKDKFSNNEGDFQQSNINIPSLNKISDIGNLTDRDNEGRTSRPNTDRYYYNQLDSIPLEREGREDNIPKHADLKIQNEVISQKIIVSKSEQQISQKRISDEKINLQLESIRRQNKFSQKYIQTSQNFIQQRQDEDQSAIQDSLNLQSQINPQSIEYINVKFDQFMKMQAKRWNHKMQENKKNIQTLNFIKQQGNFNELSYSDIFILIEKMLLERDQQIAKLNQDLQEKTKEVEIVKENRMNILAQNIEQYNEWMEERLNPPTSSAQIEQQLNNTISNLNKNIEQNEQNEKNYIHRIKMLQDKEVKYQQQLQNTRKQREQQLLRLKQEIKCWEQQVENIKQTNGYRIEQLEQYKSQKQIQAKKEKQQNQQKITQLKNQIQEQGTKILSLQINIKNRQSHINQHVQPQIDQKQIKMKILQLIQKVQEVQKINEENNSKHQQIQEKHQKLAKQLKMQSSYVIKMEHSNNPNQSNLELINQKLPVFQNLQKMSLQIAQLFTQYASQWNKINEELAQQLQKCGINNNEQLTQIQAGDIIKKISHIIGVYLNKGILQWNKDVNRYKQYLKRMKTSYETNFKSKNSSGKSSIIIK